MSETAQTPSVGEPSCRIDENATLLERAFCDRALVTVTVDDGRDSSFRVVLLKHNKVKSREVVSFAIPEDGDEWLWLKNATVAGASILIASQHAEMCGMAHVPQAGIRDIDLSVFRYSVTYG